MGKGPTDVCTEKGYIKKICQCLHFPHVILIMLLNEKI